MIRMIRNRSFAGVIGALLVCVALCPSASAQVAGGTISGTVTDPSAAAIPGAAVVIRNTATGVERTLSTNDKGFYSAPNLGSGAYQVTYSATGFATAVRDNLVLTVGGEVVANIELRVGEASETVEVQAKIPTIESGSSTLSATVEEKTIKDLPLNGRDWTQLATLEPGVVTINTQKPIQNGANARVNGGWGLQMTISGNRPQQTNYRLDGVSLNDYAGGGPGSVLGGSAGVDSVREFSVVTSNASAEYGKTSGGVLNAVTLSGANQFHGTAYEFLRNSALDARNFFDGANVPPFKRNQFGASIGGPIYLPHYKGQNRTFFFFDYEGLRQGLSTTASDTVPSRAARTGQLTSGKVTINAKVIPYLNLYPLPNGTETGDTGTFSFVGKTITDQNFYTTRVDHKISDADSIYGTYLNDISQITGPDSYNFSLSGLVSRRNLFTFGENHIFSASVANFFRLGFYRVVADGPKPLTAIDPRAGDTSLGFVPNAPVGVLTVTGLSTFSGGLGAQAESIYHYNSYQAYDDLFYTRGDHSLKFGLAIEHNRMNEFQANQPIGAYNFGSLRNFLTNVPQSFSTAIPGAQPELGLRQTVFGVYAQDDWRFRPNLTLNLGLRYEIATVPTEQHDRLATLVNLTDAAPKLGNPYFNNPTLGNFSPRIGFSWDPFKNGKTAIRGGYGLYDTLPLVYQMIGFVTAVAPFAQLGNVNSPTLTAGSFPDGGLKLLNLSAVRVAYVEQHPKRSYVEQWNLNVQRELLSGLMLQVGYTGSHGVHQPFRTNDADIVLPTQTTPGAYLFPAVGTGKRLNPNVGRIEALAWLVSSS